MSDSARGNSKSIRREVLISCLMRTLSPIGKFRLRMDEETLSPSCKALDLLCGISIKPSNESLN